MNIQNLNGAAKVEVAIKDNSEFGNTTTEGRAMVTGPTELGPVGEPKLVRSLVEFRRIFGGYLSDSDFPLYCVRALKAGAQLYVSRAGHYGDVTDPATLQGTNANATLTDSASPTPNTIEVTAKHIGAGYNNIAVEITEAVSGQAGKLDVTVTKQGHPSSPQVFRNLSADTPAEFEALNDRSVFVDFGAVATGTVPVASGALSAGQQVVGDIVTADYTGDAVAGTGIHAFDNVTGSRRIAIPGNSDPELDIALANYADQRKDVVAFLGIPVNLNVQGVKDYRNGTGAYTHNPVNTWRAAYFAGGLKINDPLKPGTIKEISEIGDLLGIYAQKDLNLGAHYSAAGDPTGVYSDVVGVVLDLGSAARTQDLDSLVEAGVNPTRYLPGIGIVLWGSRTAQLNSNTLLRELSVVEGVLKLRQDLLRVNAKSLFKPNSPQRWKSIYNSVVPLLQRAKNEQFLAKFVYNGDQNADTLGDLQVNDPALVQQGKFEVKIQLYPYAPLQYLLMGLEISLDESGAVSDVTPV